MYYSSSTLILRREEMENEFSPNIPIYIQVMEYI
ncbi:GntR family transcriptional regulator, partial [Bacillus cereus]|nr:GntR family transcriptional regulator [Bacillus cereus]